MTNHQYKHQSVAKIVIATLCAIILFGSGLFLCIRLSQTDKRAKEIENLHEAIYKAKGECEICGKKDCEVYLWKGKYYCLDCFEKE